ncbi:MAG TPA: hypothetical protein VE467_18890 [Chryseolinea sp.]|jgi:hypothetical protein|nr:hypothetical protein [Chryseolinea sp.]
MISVIGATGKYIVQPELIEKHIKTLNGLSSCMLWKSEIRAFQKVLGQSSQRVTATDDKKKVDHFQNLILYYGGEVIDGLRKKLRDHENHLAKMLESENESDIQYYKEHDAIMDELDTFSNQFKQFRGELIEFVEK